MPRAENDPAALRAGPPIWKDLAASPEDSRRRCEPPQVTTAPNGERLTSFAVRHFSTVGHPGIRSLTMDHAAFFAGVRKRLGGLKQGQVDGLNALLKATEGWTVSWVAIAQARSKPWWRFGSDYASIKARLVHRLVGRRVRRHLHPQGGDQLIEPGLKAIPVDVLVVDRRGLAESDAQQLDHLLIGHVRHSPVLRLDPLGQDRPGVAKGPAERRLQSCPKVLQVLDGRLSRSHDLILSCLWKAVTLRGVAGLLSCAGSGFHCRKRRFRYQWLATRRD